MLNRGCRLTFWVGRFALVRRRLKSKGDGIMKEQLTEINVTRENGELLASINFDTMDVINPEGVIVRLNYGKPKGVDDFEIVDGIVYIKEEVEVD